MRWRAYASWWRALREDEDCDGAMERARERPKQDGEDEDHRDDRRWRRRRVEVER